MKMIFSRLLMLLSIFFQITSHAQEVLQVTRVGNFGKNLMQQEFYNSGTLNYLLFLPEDTSAKIDGKFPLLVSLHGIGDRGNNVQLLKRDGLPQILDGYRTFPFIVLSPQCPESTEWYLDRTDTLTNELISEIIDNYPVDPNRVYVTGYSMGGIGAYDLAIRYPEMFAAAMPIAARAETYWTICDMRDVPTWAFHGNLDPLVPLHKAQFIVSVLENCGGNIIFTVYNGVYHDSWSQTYDNPDVYEWLLRQTKETTRAVCSWDSLVFYSADNQLQIATCRSLLTYARSSASLNLPEKIISLLPAVIGDAPYMIVGSEQHFRIIDLRQPNSLQIIATVNVGSVCEGLAIADNYIYVAAGDAGLKIYEITDPDEPLLIATMDTLAYCESVFIDSSFAYIAAGVRSHILEISNPAAPMYISKIKGFGGYHEFVNVNHGFAYICDSEQGVQIIDIANPHLPVTVNLVAMGMQTSHLLFQGNYGYVANGYAGLCIMDFTDVHNPQELCLFDTPGQALNIAFGNITVAGKSVAHVFVADLTAGISAIDITDPYHPQETGGISVAPPANTAYGAAYDVYIAENRAYLAYAENGLHIVDISRPDAPHLLGAFAMNGNFRDVVVKGNFAYIADIKTGLRVLDVSNPAQIVEVNQILNYKAQEITCADDRIFLAAGDSGVIIFNIADQTKPVRIGAVSSLNARAVAIAEKVLGISDYLKIYFFDVTDPMHPVPISETAPLTRGNEGFIISGKYAYVPDGDSLRIFDIAHAASPIQRGVIYTGGYGYEVAVSGKYAYLAADRNGLRVVDVSNVDQPREVGYFDDVSLARGVAADQSYIYVAEKENGLSIYRNDLITAILTENNDDLQSSFRLQQNYPNPFNPITTICYELGDDMSVRLEIYNTLGQRLLTLVDTRQQAGIHEVPFNASSFASGVYFYRLQAGRWNAIRKFVLLK